MRACRKDVNVEIHTFHRNALLLKHSTYIVRELSSIKTFIQLKASLLLLPWKSKPLTRYQNFLRQVRPRVKQFAGSPWFTVTPWREASFKSLTTLDVSPGGPQTPMQSLALEFMLKGVEFIQRGHTIYNVVQLQASDTLIWRGADLLHLQECQGSREQGRGTCKH